MNNNDKGYRFTGGDNLIGIYKLCHEIMMKNDLEGGYGAYKVTYDGKKKGEKSGISFGGNQMDMAVKENDQVRKKFISILENAIDKNGNKFFTTAEIEDIAGDQNIKLLAHKGKTPEEAFGKYLDHINKALSSDYGRKVIDEAYQVEIKDRAAHIEKFISQIVHAAVREFYNTDLGRVLLFDFHNQFGLDLKNGPNPKLLNFLNTKTTYDYSNKKPLTFTDEYNFAIHEKFLKSTTYGSNKVEDIERRLKNIKDRMAEDEIVIREDGEVRMKASEDTVIEPKFNLYRSLKIVDSVNEAAEFNYMVVINSNSATRDCLLEANKIAEATGIVNSHVLTQFNHERSYILGNYYRYYDKSIVVKERYKNMNHEVSEFERKLTALTEKYKQLAKDLCEQGVIIEEIVNRLDQAFAKDQITAAGEFQQLAYYCISGDCNNHVLVV